MHQLVYIMKISQAVVLQKPVELGSVGSFVGSKSVEHTRYAVVLDLVGVIAVIPHHTHGVFPCVHHSVPRQDTRVMLVVQIKSLLFFYVAEKEGFYSLLLFVKNMLYNVNIFICQNI